LKHVYGKSQKVVSSSPPPIPDAVKFVRTPNEYLGQLKAWVESWISHSITLIAIFIFSDTGGSCASLLGIDWRGTLDFATQAN
jgi:hypothetical protein